MKLKIKILIGVLVVGLILIGGKLIWNLSTCRDICYGNKVQPQVPTAFGFDCASIDILACSKKCGAECETHKDCLEGFICNFENCRCISETKSEKQVTLTTDKTEYEEGEEMKIVINNKRDRPIYLLLEEDVYADSIKIEIERHENGSWVSALSPFTLFSKNQKCGSFGQGPRIGCEKIEPQEKLEIEKSLYYSKCVDEQPKQFSFPHGRYRLKIGIGEKCWAGTGKEAPNIIYSNEFTIK